MLMYTIIHCDVVNKRTDVKHGKILFYIVGDSAARVGHSCISNPMSVYHRMKKNYSHLIPLISSLPTSICWHFSLDLLIIYTD